jgi:hypothetical protein
MDKLARVIRRRPYNRYHSMTTAIEPVCQVLATTPETDYSLRAISEQTGIPVTTLWRWKVRIAQDKNWRPGNERFRDNPRLFDDAIESQMATYIDENFIVLGRSLTMSILQQTILMLVHNFVATGDLPEAALAFKCSTKFVRRFLKRNGLSFRRGRPTRRPELDENECFDFLVSFHLSLMMWPPSVIVNFDESSWRVVMTSDRTVAHRGAEVVKQYVDGDVKASFTFFASVLADGTKLPLIFIAKGKTDRCHKQLGTHPRHNYDVWHSATGWCDSFLVLRYLGWLRAHIQGEHIVLILDQFDAHDTVAVYNRADQLNIELVFIPKGGTGKYQPLDRRVFGALKSKGRAKWTQHIFENPGAACTRAQAAELLLECWDELPEACIQSGWDLDEEKAADASEKEEDPEWDIRIDNGPTDSEDESELDVSDDIDEDPVAKYGWGIS